MASSTSKICFANISATEFLSWGIQLKEITSKEEASEITSDMIPYKPAKEDPKLIAFTKIAESDSHLIFDKPRSLHFKMASWRTSPSATKGDETWRDGVEYDETLF